MMNIRLPPHGVRRIRPDGRSPNALLPIPRKGDSGWGCAWGPVIGPIIGAWAYVAFWSA